MKKIVILIIFLLYLILNFCNNLFSGLKVLSDFDIINNDNWKGTAYGAAVIGNYVASDYFYGSSSIEFVGTNIGGGGGMTDKGLWDWFYPVETTWSNYCKFIFAFKPVNIYQAGSINQNLNFGLDVKEVNGGDWNWEVWEYYITNQNLTLDTWYLWEVDITNWDGLNNTSSFASRIDKWRDAGTWDTDGNGNQLPPEQVRQIYFFMNSQSADLDNQRIRLDFMSIISTPFARILNQTNFLPVTLSWTDVADNHPLFRVQVATNKNSVPVIDHMITDAEDLSTYVYNASAYNLKPRHKYYWKICSGYIVDQASGFYSGAYKKYNLNHSISDIPSNSSVTLWSHYSTWAEFTNRGIKPFNPALFSPADQSTNFAVNDLAFSWEDLKEEGADIYRIIISTNQAFTRLITTRTLCSNRFILSGVSNYFTVNSNYYYSVQAGYSNYQGSLVWDTVKTNMFTFNYNAPALLSPADNTTIKKFSQTFQWENVYAGVTYTLQISDQPSFAALIDTDSGTELSSASISFTDKYKNNLTYYWRVQSSANIGIKYSEVFQFYLDLEDGTGDFGEVRVYPTSLEKSDRLNIALYGYKRKVLDVRILVYDVYQNMVADKEYVSGRLPGSLFSLYPEDLHLNKGFYFIYIITRFSDNTIDKSKVFPIVVR